MVFQKIRDHSVSKKKKCSLWHKAKENRNFRDWNSETNLRLRVWIVNLIIITYVRDAPMLDFKFSVLC